MCDFGHEQRLWFIARLVDPFIYQLRSFRCILNKLILVVSRPTGCECTMHQEKLVHYSSQTNRLKMNCDRPKHRNALFQMRPKMMGWPLNCGVASLIRPKLVRAANSKNKCVIFIIFACGSLPLSLFVSSVCFNCNKYAVLDCARLFYKYLSFMEEAEPAINCWILFFFLFACYFFFHLLFLHFNKKTDLSLSES